MATWTDMADEAVRAAGVCLSEGHYRSAVSRSYYGLFSAICAALHDVGLTPPSGREAWPHAKLQDLVAENLRKRLGVGRVRDVRRFVNEGYRMRIAADYRTMFTVDEVTARRCLANVTSVMNLLERTR